MKTDAFAIDQGLEPRKRRRAWYILALALFLLSLIAQQPLIFLVALFSLVLGIVPGFWYRNALRHLLVHQQVNPQHLFLGEEVVLSFSIENQKLFPVSWLQFESDVTPLLTTLTRHSSQRENIGQIAHAWILWPFQRVTRRYRMRCYARGCYTFGPITLRSSDPLGWLECKVTVPLHETLLVYPLIAPPEAFGLSSLYPSGEGATSRRLLEDPLRVMGVRDYQLGDDPRRIHWKATARSGSLRSKIYEYSSLRRMLLLLDTGNDARAWMGIDQEMQEFSIAVAASLAVWALDEGYMVGLLANSAMMTPLSADSIASQPILQPETRSLEKLKTTEISAPGVSVSFACDHGQYERLLSVFARLVSYNNIPLETLIEREDAMFAVGTTVTLVSVVTALTQATVERLLDMRSRGIAIYLVLTGDRKGKTMAETYDLPVHYAGGREQWHELIHAFGEEKSQANGARPAQLQLD